jgi:hypothetical protein
MREELDIIFSPQGDPRVPRLVPIVADPKTQVPGVLCPDVPPNHAAVDIHRTGTHLDFSVIVASVTYVNPDDVEEYPPGSLVISLQHRAPECRATIDLGSACIIPSNTAFQNLVDRVPGIVISVLAPGLSTFNRSHRLRSLSVLVTHCGTIIGSTVCQIYSREGVKLSRTSQDVSILDLSRMGRGSFDLVISGYDDNAHAQVLRTLLRPSSGKLFLWHRELLRMLREEPCSIGEALRVAISRDFLQNFSSVGDAPTSLDLNVYVDPQSVPLGAVFHADKTYIILGGIGSLGAAVALFMAQVRA